MKDNLPVPVVESETSSPALFTSVSRFLTTNGTVVIAQRGSTTSMPCEVVSLGDGVVSNQKLFHSIGIYLLIDLNQKTLHFRLG